MPSGAIVPRPIRVYMVFIFILGEPGERSNIFLTKPDANRMRQLLYPAAFRGNEEKPLLRPFDHAEESQGRVSRYRRLRTTATAKVSNSRKNGEIVPPPLPPIPSLTPTCTVRTVRALVARPVRRRVVDDVNTNHSTC